MGEIRPKTCEQGKDRRDQLVAVQELMSAHSLAAAQVHSKRWRSVLAPRFVWSFQI